MAQCKPAFAELLLPHAFADLAVQPDSGSLALQLGSLISAQLLPRLHRHPKAARLLLSCLNHLRSLYLDAKVAGSGGSAGGSKGKKGRADGDAVAAEIELWRKVGPLLGMAGRHSGEVEWRPCEEEGAAFQLSSLPRPAGPILHTKPLSSHATCLPPDLLP